MDDAQAQDEITQLVMRMVELEWSRSPCSTHRPNQWMPEAHGYATGGQGFKFHCTCSVMILSEASLEPQLQVPQGTGTGLNQAPPAPTAASTLAVPP